MGTCSGGSNLFGRGMCDGLARARHILVSPLSSSFTHQCVTRLHRWNLRCLVVSGRARELARGGKKMIGTREKTTKTQTLRIIVDGRQ